MLQALIPILAPLLTDVVRSKLPAGQQVDVDQIERDIQLRLWEQASEMNKAAADVVKTEAASEHWLTATWRPITMLIFVALIVARWFGWSAPGMSEAEALKLWSIVEFGLGGYVVGRSVERITPTIADAIKNRGANGQS